MSGDYSFVRLGEEQMSERTSIQVVCYASFTRTVLSFSKHIHLIVQSVANLKHRSDRPRPLLFCSQM